MSVYRRLQRVYESAPELPYNDRSKIVLMSDCHRGTGSGADNFASNQHLFDVALRNYDLDGYTYIELGDGDELWENKRFFDIASEYDYIFARLSKLYREGRLFMLYGNHDAVKGKGKWVETQLSCFCDHRTLARFPLFPGIRVHEGIRLHNTVTGRDILLLHGHQADFFNDKMWWVSKFLVRYVWKNLELVGIKDPMSTAANPKRRDTVERMLTNWCAKEKRMLVAGHTHRPIFPKAGEGLYFNDGSCVHPWYITALEIAGGVITLVKWGVQARRDGTLYVAREVLEGPAAIENYFLDENQLAAG